MDSGDKKTASAAALEQAHGAGLAAEGPTETSATGRGPYEPPRLRHLGSVRALTLGATGRRNDVNGGKRGSSAEIKENIRYLSADERSELANQVLGLKLATYDYKPGVGEPAGRHLGFIIEDAPRATFVRPEEKVVDVYAFASALAAVVQRQEETIRRLETEVAALRNGEAATKTR